MTETRSGIAGDLESIWRGALRRTQAVPLVRAALSAEPLPAGPVRVLALGKAALPMAEAALEALGDRAARPALRRPRGGTVRRSPGRRWWSGPTRARTAASAAAGAAILAWAARGAGLPVLALVSGGGSALAVAPAEGLSFEEKVEAVAALMRAGAPIGELNALRKHLSRLKGGQLAARLAPAEAPGAPGDERGFAAGANLVRVLVLSDVPGDDLSTIASGPFAPDPTTFADALRSAAARGAGSPRRSTRGSRRAPAASSRRRRSPGTRGSRASRTGSSPARWTSRAPPRRRRGRAGSRRRWIPPRSPATSPPSRRGSPPGRVPTPGAGRASSRSAASRRSRSRPPRARRTAAAPSTSPSSPPSRSPGSPPRSSPRARTGATARPSRPARWWTAARRPPPRPRGSTSPRRSRRRAPGRRRVALGAAIPREETGTHLCDLVLVAVE